MSMKKKSLVKILVLITIIFIGVFILIIVSNAIKANSLSFLNQNKKIRILIVPGHEPNAGGADEFKKIKERDLNLQLSKLIADKLASSQNMEIILARDDVGWNSDLKNYVETSSSTIMDWVFDMKNIMLSKINAGKVKLINPDMVHNEATDEAVLYLYATNKWIEENNIDLVLHVHFNNNPKINGRPNYSGYCIYIPDKQYGNASSSRIFANYLNDEISKIENKSNMPQEKDIIIEDQQLIATGNYDTLKIPAAVVEYAYIYEPMMVSSTTRNKFMINAASSTATAIENYLSNN
jgi:N-acetylmuramoyl-L-alanine amidase